MILGLEFMKCKRVIQCLKSTYIGEYNKYTKRPHLILTTLPLAETGHHATPHP